jgi:hypothetical protein
MDGIPEINKNQSVEERVGAVGAPPPPTEVKIRTMKSDVAALAASGGGFPKFQNIKVSGLSLEKGIDSPEAVHRNSAIITILITIIALVVLGTLGYFAYRILRGGTI